MARQLSIAPWLFTIAVFVSASLVFSVQPLVGKMLLPLLGGSAAIWNTSLAFFQGALLLGYAYAHFLQRIGSIRRQMVVHVAVLALAALTLPLHVSQAAGAPWTGAPAIWLVLVLALSIGAPFAVLSATAPLLQAWCARLGLVSPSGKDVYGLYAASNLGSLIALVAYPVIIEPTLGLSVQALSWTVGYGTFAVGLAGLAAFNWRSAAIAPKTAITTAPPVAWREKLTWVLLAAAPSSLLVGVTGHISSDVASAPFLWVTPLILYLVTFIIAFARGKPASYNLLLAQVALTPMALMTLRLGAMPMPIALLIHLSAFFVTALVCHSQLVARRPEEGRLTEFYLAMSVGGVLGGAFNAFLAPVLFNGVWEYPAVLVLACLARPWSRAPLSIHDKAWLGMGLVWTAPLLIPQLKVPDLLVAALTLAPAAAAVLIRTRTRPITLLYGALALACAIQSYGKQENHRSFFGVAHIEDVKTKPYGTLRYLTHGTTMHGVQFMDPAQRCRTTTYYARPTLIGRVFTTEMAAKPALNIGAVGLGTGTVASYVRKADRMRFYEIDPLMAKLAFDPAHFSFIGGCAQGPVDVVLGDARLKLAAAPAASSDLLLVDAFSSDAVPSHLLTVEGVREYLRVIKPDGVAVLHLSNRNMDLRGPAAAAAKAAGAHALAGEFWTTAGTPSAIVSSQYVLLISRSPEALERYRGKTGWSEPKPSARPWTDDYTNVIGAVIAQARQSIAATLR